LSEFQRIYTLNTDSMRTIECSLLLAYTCLANISPSIDPFACDPLNYGSCPLIEDSPSIQDSLKRTEDDHRLSQTVNTLVSPASQTSSYSNPAVSVSQDQSIIASSLSTTRDIDDAASRSIFIAPSDSTTESVKTVPSVDQLVPSATIDVKAAAVEQVESAQTVVTRNEGSFSHSPAETSTVSHISTPKDGGNPCHMNSNEPTPSNDVGNTTFSIVASTSIDPESVVVGKASSNKDLSTSITPVNLQDKHAQSSLTAATENSTTETTAPKMAETVVSNATERFNYASFDCGALILATNPECKSASSILMKSQDQYLLNPCSATKFIEVELCQEILLDSFMLANFEFFSSTFKQFKLLATNNAPPKPEDWKLIGVFTGANLREKQYFNVPPPHSWSK
jgi:Sad1 / UNC-like C-terminal